MFAVPLRTLSKWPPLLIVDQSLRGEEANEIGSTSKKFRRAHNGKLLFSLQFGTTLEAKLDNSKVIATNISGIQS